MSTGPNIVILFGDDEDFAYPKNEFPFYLSEYNGTTLIELLVNSCANLNPAKIICMLPDVNVKKYHLHNMTAQMHPLTTVFPVHHSTNGAACTALLASDIIDTDAELIIISANEILDVSIEKIVNQYRTEGHDAGVVTFRSIHPRYSFARIDGASYVEEVAEKNPISTDALAGIYWFNSGAMFVQAVKNMIRKDAKVDDSFYIAPALNELILLHKRIGTYRVQPNQYHPLKNKSQTHAHSQGVDTYEFS